MLFLGLSFFSFVFIDFILVYFGDVNIILTTIFLFIIFYRHFKDDFLAYFNLFQNKYLHKQ